MHVKQLVFLHNNTLFFKDINARMKINFHCSEMFRDDKFDVDCLIRFSNETQDYISVTFRFKSKGK